ncbi:MAG: type II secretion system F family protein [Pirellulales bacterium]
MRWISSIAARAGADSWADLSIRAALGGGSTGTAAPNPRIRRHELTFLLRNLATLIDNGVPLTRSLATLARERTLKQYRPLLVAVHQQLETGEPFSAVLAHFPAAFDQALISQVRVAERSGTLAGTLGRLATQLEQASDVRSQALRRLAYPAVLVVSGLLVVTFFLIFVIPVFQQTYDEAKVPLPMVTRILIAAGDFAVGYGWIVALAAAAAAFGLIRLRSNKATGAAFDATMLRLPLFGEWLRDMAVLGFMDVLGNLLEGGFTIVDSLRISAGTVGNRALRQCVESLHAALIRGERFSRELDRHQDVFPPVVMQLVVVGESTGKLVQSIGQVRQHLRREVERRTSLLVGTIEPILTISLAVMIGGIVLAIYLPMFDMIGAVQGR